jgi:thiosulfate/3-mercaptopyruvate sulfurtransferase
MNADTLVLLQGKLQQPDGQVQGVRPGDNFLPTTSAPIDNEVMDHMNPAMTNTKRTFALLAVPMLLAAAAFAYQASLIPASRLIQPDELAKLLRSPKAEKPLMIQVGSHVLYSEAHIPGSEYVGPASTTEGIQRLRKRVEALPRNKFIVIYCGCCPWSHCPNVKPANDALQAMGFTNFKVLYIANNFGADWVDKGYPVTKGD